MNVVIQPLVCTDTESLLSVGPGVVRDFALGGGYAEPLDTRNALGSAIHAWLAGRVGCGVSERTGGASEVASATRVPHLGPALRTGSIVGVGITVPAAETLEVPTQRFAGLWSHR